MGAVGAENRSYEMQIAQKYLGGDGVGPNARRLAYGIKRHSACRSTTGNTGKSPNMVMGIGHLHTKVDLVLHQCQTVVVHIP
jgi:hypothetical protein